MHPHLPIHKYEKEILQTVSKSNPILIVGSTGSGKTTQLPQFLHNAGYSKQGIIGVSQPRRVAAISVAARVAQEMHCSLGSKVGYQVRFDNCTSEDTRIKYMTDGCLLREFLDDRELSRYSVIVLDEAHERSLDTDILFGLMKALFLETANVDSEFQSTTTRRNNQLKVIIMSATLNHKKFSEFFNNCPVFEIPGQLYPIKDIYCNHITLKNLDNPIYLSKAVDTVMEIHINCSVGDVLVFLTGQAEIERACDLLYEKAEQINYNYDVKDERIKAMLILPLYGSMQADQQQRVFDKCDPRVRKVVVATNIAGTSLTIDGIRYVVDSGFVKQMSYNPLNGMENLEVVLISRSEANQRRGRAGRTCEGKCYKLYTKEIYENSMKEDTIPEIQRVNLCKVVLSLKCMGLNNVLHFHYLDPPSERLLLRALWHLYVIGAITREGFVTKTGRKIIQFPLPPNLAKAVVESWRYNCHSYLLPIAAMLSVENVFIKPGKPKKMKQASKIHAELAAAAGGKNDFATLLYVYSSYQHSSSSAKWCKDHFIHKRALRSAVTICHQLKRILLAAMEKEETQPRQLEVEKSSELLRRCLCAGYFCNIARKSEIGHDFRTMDGHGTVVSLHPSSVLHGQEGVLNWIVFHEMVCTSKVFVRSVCPVKHEWVKEWLPRLHDVDLYALSHCLTMANNSKSSIVEDDDPLSNSYSNDQAFHEVAKKLQRRNTEASVTEAKQRYFRRQQEKK